MIQLSSPRSSLQESKTVIKAICAGQAKGAVFLERVEIAAHDDAGETGRFGLRERMAELERICEGS